MSRGWMIRTWKRLGMSNFVPRALLRRGEKPTLYDVAGKRLANQVPL